MTPFIWFYLGALGGFLLGFILAGLLRAAKEG